MRIAMLTNNYKPFIGGVPVSIERLAMGLRQLGHEVYIFAPQYDQVEEEPYVVRYRTRKKKLKGDFVVPDIFDPVIGAAFSEISFDVIHVHQPILIGYKAQYLGRKYDIPVVFTYHTRYEQYLHYFKLYDRLEKHYNQEKEFVFKALGTKMLAGCEELVSVHNRIFTNHCELVFAPTPGIKQYLMENGTVSMVEIMPTGLTQSDFNCDAGRMEAIRKEYGQGKPYLFCTVSRMEKEKNIDFIFEGLLKLKTEKGDCFRLLLIGDGSEKQTLAERGRQLGLGDNLLFLGSVPHEEIRNYYHASDLFLFASQSETQGIVLLEAMAAGLPVIAVQASGVCDVVKEGWNGFMTDKNPDRWAQRVREILEDQVLWGNMSQAARREAQEYLDVEVAKTAERAYRKVLYSQKREEICASEKLIK